MNPTYKNLALKLETAIRELPHAPAPVLRTQIAKWVEARPFSEIRAADAACRRFATSNEWPMMEDAVLAQVHLRLEAALDLCRGMSRESAQPIQADEQATLEMMLVGYWHDQGPGWAQWKFGS